MGRLRQPHKADFVYNGCVVCALVLYRALPVVVFLPKLLMNCILTFTPREHDALQALVLRDMLFKGNMQLFE